VINYYLFGSSLIFNDKERILKAFSKLKERKILKTEDELLSQDRISFENAIFESFGIIDIMDNVSESLLSMQRARKSVIARG